VRSGDIPEHWPTRGSSNHARGNQHSARHDDPQTKHRHCRATILSMPVRRSWLVALAIALAFFAAVESAAAALEVRLTVNPTKPRAGSVSTILLRPYWPYLRGDGSCCRLEPEPADVQYPFRLEAVSPAGRVFKIRVHRTNKPFVWSSRFVFRSGGRWVVREPHWGPRYVTSAGGRPRVVIRVRADPGASADRTRRGGASRSGLVRG
jgi:hypothetical protein